MNTNLKSKSRTTLSCVLTIFCLGLATSAKAAELYWDANGDATAAVGGTGNWTGGSTWRPTSSTGTPLQSWADGSSANFPAASTITLNGSVAVTGITNVTGLCQIIGSGGNTIDFGAGGSFVTSGGSGTAGMRSSALLKGNVTLVPKSGSFANTPAIWIKANNTLLTNTTIAAGVALANVVVDDAGALGTASSSVLITNGSALMLGALTAEIIGSTAGANVGASYNAFTNTIGGGYIRSRVGSNTLNGPITITAAGSGFITRAAAGVSLTLASTATLELNANTLNLNVDSTGDGVFVNSVISGTGGLQTVGPATVTSGANGTGTTRLNAANTFSGTARTAPNLGTLALGNVNALQNASLDTGASSGSQAVTFIVAGYNTYNLGALTGSDDLAVGGNTLSVGTKAGDTTFSAIISGSGGKLTKVGADKLTLGATNTYDGLTTISSGTLALGASGLLAAGSSVSIASGATFDVSALATYTHGASAALTATGTASTPAVIFGGTTVDLITRPVTLNSTPDSFSGDANSPALNISQGALTIGGAITVVNNGASPLGAGSYVLISQASGTITGTPTLSGTVGGLGLVGGTSAIITNTGTSIDLVVQAATPTTTTVTRVAGTGSTTTYGDTLQFKVSVVSALATGTVELRDGGPAGTLIGSGTLVGGTNVVTPADSALTIGAHANIVALYLGDVNFASSVSTALSTQTVTNKPLTVSGATADSKYFDTTTTATLSGGTLNGVESGDTVTLNPSGTFASASPGTGIAVTSTSTLGGASATNYVLTQPTGLAADIYATAIWTGTAGDTFWNTGGNWLTNVVPNGANIIADFTTLDITTDQIVNLNSARTVGHLTFGDTDTNTAAGWTLANNSSAGNILTLAGTTPTVSVAPLGPAKIATISAVVTGTNGLTKSGAGTLALTGANTYSGGTTISNGTLRFNADAALGAASSANNITLNGGALASSAANFAISSARSMTIGAGGGTLAHPNSGILSYGGIIGGPGVLTLNTTGTSGSGISLTSGQSTNTGGVIFTGSSANFAYMSASSTGNPGSLVSGPFGTGTVTFNGPGTRSTTGGDTTNGNALIFASDVTFPTLASEKTLTLTGPVTLSSNRTLTVNVGTTVPGKSVTITNVISDGGNNYGLTKAGTGLLVLSGPNTYGGDTTVNAGTFELGQAYLAAASTVTVDSSAILQLDFSVTNTVASLILGGVTNGPGVYDSINSAPYITGTGSLKVPVAGGPASTNADLISLVLSPAGTLSPTFASNVLTYAASEAFANTPTVTVVNADLTATNQLIYNGATNALASGVPSSPLSLTLGVNNPVVVRVTAQDGLTVQTYTVNVTRQPNLTPVTLTNTVSGSTLTLSWPADHLGYSLQVQTNSRSLGLKTNWVVLPGSASVTTTNLPIDKANPTVFYRLVYP